MDIDSLRIKRFCELTGNSESAVRHYINDGVWMDGREYTRISNKTLFISIIGYEAWVKSQRKEVPPAFRIR